MAHILVHCWDQCLIKYFSKFYGPHNTKSIELFYQAFIESALSYFSLIYIKFLNEFLVKFSCYQWPLHSNYHYFFIIIYWIWSRALIKKFKLAKLLLIMEVLHFQVGEPRTYAIENQIQTIEIEVEGFCISCLVS